MSFFVLNLSEARAPYLPKIHQFIQFLYSTVEQRDLESLCSQSDSLMNIHKM